MTVYQNGCLVTVNGSLDVISSGTLAVDGSMISYAGPHRDFPGAETVDCSGCIIMPGFVNGHIHMPMTFFRGYADDMELHKWLNERIFPLEARHTALTQYHGAQLAACELIRTGTTTVNDMYYDGEQTARALKEAGLSGIVSTCLIGAAPDHDRKLELAKELAEHYRGDPLIRTAVAPHAEYTATAPLLELWGRVAADTKQPIHIHCSETRSEHTECIGRHGLTPVGLFEKLGMMESPMYLAHCVWLSEEDIETVRRHGASVLHNPCSNLKLASGVAPVPRMLEKGVKIALSTDSCSSNNTLDMWEEMRFASLIHKGHALDPLAVSAGQALYMATRGAALALGYSDRGSLEAGMRADFIVADTKEPSMQIPTNVMNLIVYSGNSRDIVMTVGGGRVLYDRGVYTTLDTERIYAQCREDFEHVFRD